MKELQGTRTVLVVEDEPAVRRLVAAVLIRTGYSVIQAGCADEALMELEKVTPDLILLDYVLPDMDGVLLLRIIRSRPPWQYVPIIFLTGKVDLPSKRQALEFGALDYIAKPFDPEDLAARIDAQVRRKDREEEMRRKAAATAEATRRALETSEQRFRTLVENSFDLVCELDSELRMVYASPNHKSILGYDPVALVGESWIELVHLEDRSSAGEKLRRALQGQSGVRTQARFRDPGERWRWLDISGSVLADAEPRLLLVARDITQEKELEARLAHLALRDSVTGLGNQQQFTAELASILQEWPRRGRGALLVVDLDDFKLVNDTQGHPAGDRALLSVAHFLTEIFPRPHSICRVRGDEFCVILRGVGEDSARAAGERLIEAMHKHPIVLDGRGVAITLSAGIALIEPSITFEELTARADSALYAAKAAGKGRFVLYKGNSEELVRIKSGAAWYSRITEGLFQGRFELFYQPIVDFKRNRLFCSEALLRYRAGDGKIHLPGEFLPAAERFRLMQQLDSYVLARVLTTLRENPTSRVAINLSGQSVSDPEMHGYIRTHLAESGVDPKRVIFEITETVFITNLCQARRLVEELRAIGCGFALDDFGSGFSSLSYLRSLPVNIVKIYGGFVKRIASDSVDFTLLRSIHETAHLLGKQTVAEFVNSKKTCALLKQIGVDYGQGFYLGRARPQFPHAEPAVATA
ncbi:MAG: EAL domain-containing protein [Verrucomicrobia bacterium]|nr:EAL domain-containing protein [Verrucomicrobiota bacterium]